ncbi:unnamed protein product [Rangifer tarandus platyrhynchus]|uniref:Uncharacterized protein n=1 Tax=Rangifer tarandus platyrhynchus TaxID=3082113 RepID=A0ABN8Y3V3_RANTA|nr:unnamed protein product [Rangifer tarandus platyrhynchus]
MKRSPVYQGRTAEQRPRLLGGSAASRFRKGTLRADDGPDPATRFEDGASFAALLCTTPVEMKGDEG